VDGEWGGEGAGGVLSKPRPVADSLIYRLQTQQHAPLKRAMSDHCVNQCLDTALVERMTVHVGLFLLHIN